MFYGPVLSFLSYRDQILIIFGRTVVDHVDATQSPIPAFFNNQVVHLQENTPFDLLPRSVGQDHI